MLWRNNYAPVASVEDTEGAAKPPMQLSNWFVPRRLRTALIAGLLLLLVGLFVFQNPVSLERLQDYAKHNATASEAAACNCSTTGGSQTDTSSNVLSVKWSDFAYIQYVTNNNYLCNSLMIFDALRRYNTKADLLMMYPEGWKIPAAGASGEGVSVEGRLVAKARDEYKVNLSPIKVQTFTDTGDPTWQDSYTKLLAFKQTQYKRVVSLDSDANVLDQMDELFLLPSAPVAMPRAYWMDQPFLSSQLVVIEPSETEWKRVEAAMEKHESTDYDMDILNKLYIDSCIIIPHRKYDLLTGEFQHAPDKHETYLGSADEMWDAKKAYEEAKFVHFSDWPLPKPWIQSSSGKLEEHQPKCYNGTNGMEDCSNREIWLQNRRDFSERRERVCGSPYGVPGQKLKRSDAEALPKRSKYEPSYA